MILNLVLRLIRIKDSINVLARSLRHFSTDRSFRASSHYSGDSLYRDRASLHAKVY